MKNIKLYLSIVVTLFIISLILSLTKLTFLESMRICFGFVFLLFLPGYIFIKLFLKNLDLLEEIVLSFLLSMAAVPLLIFYLNRLFSVRINVLNIFLAVVIIILIVVIFKVVHKKYTSNRIKL